MNIKKLAKASYTKDNLDEKKISRIIKLLKKGELREYIKALKLIESKHTVKVFVSHLPDNNLQKQILDVFKNKKVEFIEDKLLIAGIRIEDFDNIYEANLKNSIKNMVNFINQ